VTAPRPTFAPLEDFQTPPRAATTLEGPSSTPAETPQQAAPSERGDDVSRLRAAAAEAAERRAAEARAAQGQALPLGEDGGTQFLHCRHVELVICLFVGSSAFSKENFRSLCTCRLCFLPVANFFSSLFDCCSEGCWKALQLRGFNKARLKRGYVVCAGWKISELFH
jgi:hypothetical protein